MDSVTKLIPRQTLTHQILSYVYREHFLDYLFNNVLSASQVLQHPNWPGRTRSALAYRFGETKKTVKKHNDAVSRFQPRTSYVLTWTPNLHRNTTFGIYCAEDGGLVVYATWKQILRTYLRSNNMQKSRWESDSSSDCHEMAWRLGTRWLSSCISMYLDGQEKPQRTSVAFDLKFEPGTPIIRLVYLWTFVSFTYVVICENMKTNYLHHNFGFISFLVHLRSMQCHIIGDEMLTLLPGLQQPTAWREHFQSTVPTSRLTCSISYQELYMSDQSSTTAN
jgi:hypothetical protein